MSTVQPSTLETAIRRSGEDWLIDWLGPKDEAIDHLRGTLDAVNRLAHERLGASAPNLSEDAILAEYNRHPQQVRGFFQALGATRTPDMLLMAWRVIQGAAIKSVDLSYRRQKSFEVRVVLESPYGGNDETYASTHVQDFALFRHIGVLEIDGRPVFDGFYALKLGGK